MGHAPRSNPFLSSITVEDSNMSRFPSRFTRTALLIGVSLVSITACGSDSSSSPASTAATSPTAATTTAPLVTAATEPAGSTADTIATTSLPATDNTLVNNDNPFSVETANGTLTLSAMPTKIVSLAPTHTETLFAIGAGAQVVAVDDQSNYPAEAAAVSSALSGYTPNVEAIAGYQPDLVILSDDSGGIVAQLQALDIPVWVGSAPDTLEEAYTEIEQLGVLTGRFAEATGLVGEMQTGITAALDSLPETEVPVTYYHELDNTLFSITSNTFLGQIYSLAGLINIADSAEASSNYPQLNSEFIITADPELIFLGDTKCCGESPATVAARDGWAGIAAVTNGGVIAMDDDIASRWGPRIVDYMQAVVAAVTAAAAVPAG